MDVSRYPASCRNHVLTSSLRRNVWGPHRQPDLVNVLGTHYELSIRLQAIIRSSPPKDLDSASQETEKPSPRPSKSKRKQKNDPEIALTSSDLQVPKYPSSNSSTAPALVRSNTMRGNSNGVDHYTLADRMKNYHAIDIGPHCKQYREPRQK